MKRNNERNIVGRLSSELRWSYLQEIFLCSAPRFKVFIEYLEIMLNCRPEASSDERLPRVL